MQHHPFGLWLNSPEPAIEKVYHRGPSHLLQYVLMLPRGVVEFSFKSNLPVRYLQDIEQLIFFNEHQKHVRTRIMELLDQYGVPQIVRDEGSLHVGLEEHPDAQCLFLLAGDSSDAELLGFALYLRDSPDTITVVHVAVVESVLTEDETDPLLAIRLLHTIRKLARRIRGLKWVRVLYGEGSQTRLPVGSAPRNHEHP
jgi:hypothetical protein